MLESILLSMLLNKILLDTLSQQASENPRLRQNYNLHESLDAPSQRLFNALQLGTKLNIHRHTTTSETCIVIRGSVRYTLYDDNKNIIDSFILKAGSDNFGYNVPAGQWHCYEPLEPDTVIFGCKDGPYTPLEPYDVLIGTNE